MKSLKILRTLFIIYFSIGYLQNAYAETDTICGTESLDSATFVNLPWIENNQFLLNLVDSIDNSCNNCRMGSDGLSIKKYQVSIKAEVIDN